MNHITLEEYLKAEVEKNIKDFSTIISKLASSYPLVPVHFVKNCSSWAEASFESSLLEDADSFKKAYYNLLLDADENNTLDKISLEKDFPQKNNFQNDIIASRKHWTSYLKRSLEDYRKPVQSKRKKFSIA